MLKPDRTPYCIYCAGPLFNPSERAEMEMLADTIEQVGFKTFVPHRDGLLFRAIVPDIMKAGYPVDVAQWMARQAIFALDVYQLVKRCNGALIDLNGRVPDEGAIAEGAIAWAVGKAVVLFKDDTRSLIDGLDNPLVAGLGNFRVVSRVEDLPSAMSQALTARGSATMPVAAFSPTLQRAVERGQEIASAAKGEDTSQLVHVMTRLLDEFRAGGTARAKSP